MNTQPNRKPPIHAAENDHIRERYFWQSRGMMRDPPHLTDIYTLARSIRRGTQENLTTKRT